MTALPGTLRRRWPALLVAAALLALLAASLYGLLGPAVFGHYGYHIGEHATRARHGLRSGAWLPYNAPGWTLPDRGTLYLHHPLLMHPWVTLAMGLLGDHESTLRLTATFAALASLAALAALLWRTDDAPRAALASALFAAVPIHLWYAPHIDHGFPSIAFLLLFFRAYLRFSSPPDRAPLRSLLPALAFLSLSACFEWSPFLAVVPVGLHALILSLRRRVHPATLPLLVLAMVLPLAFHFWVVRHTGHGPEMLSSYSHRTAPIDPAAYWRRILVYSRSYFGWPLLLALPPWLLGVVARLFFRQNRPRDLVGLSFLFAVAFYAAWFKDGVNTHGYRLLYGGVAVVIAALGVADDAAALLAWAARRLRVPAPPTWTHLALAASLLLATLPASREGLLESRDHQGIPDWKTFDAHEARSAFARAVKSTLQPTDLLFLHPAFPVDRMELFYYLDTDQRHNAPLTLAATLPPADRARALFLFPPSRLSGRDQAALAELKARHPYRQVGDWAWVDLRREEPGSQVFTLRTPGPERPWWRRYLEGPHPWPLLVPP